MADWNDNELRRRLKQKLPQLDAFVVDDTGFARKGMSSMGVARQYLGILG